MGSALHQNPKPELVPSFSPSLSVEETVEETIEETVEAVEETVETVERVDETVEERGVGSRGPKGSSRWPNATIRLQELEVGTNDEVGEGRGGGGGGWVGPGHGPGGDEGWGWGCCEQGYPGSPGEVGAHRVQYLLVVNTRR